MKKSKVRYNKRTILVAIFTVLLLCNISLIAWPQSRSYFFDFDDDALVYKTNLYNLYSEGTMKLEEAEASKARLSFSFIANPHFSDTENDQYVVKIPSGCTFENVFTTGTAETVSATNQYVFSNPAVGGSNNFEISCPVTVNEDLNIVATVSEKINDETPFVYYSYNYVQTYSEYVKLIETGGSTTIKPGECDGDRNQCIYNEFKTWLDLSSQKMGYHNEIVAYVNSVFPNGTALVNSDNFEALPGFIVRYDADEDAYTYEMLENFVGYARTYNANMSGDSVNIYFTSKDANVVTEAFDYYLKNYIYVDDAESYATISKYVQDEGGITNLVLGGIKIPGIFATSEEGKFIFVKSTIMSYAKPSNRLKYGTADSMYDGLVVLIKANYGSIVSGADASGVAAGTGLYKIIMSNGNEIFVSALHGLTDPDVATAKYKLDFSNSIAKSFTDYFIVYDEKNNYYLLVNVSSEYDNPNIPLEEKSHNIVDIQKLDYKQSDVKVTFTNTDATTLTVKISSSTKDKVMEVVKSLDEYFAVTTEEGNITIDKDTATEYAITYTVKKVVYDGTTVTSKDEAETAVSGSGLSNAAGETTGKLEVPGGSVGEVVGPIVDSDEDSESTPDEETPTPEPVIPSTPEHSGDAEGDGEEGSGSNDESNEPATGKVDNQEVDDNQGGQEEPPEDQGANEVTEESKEE